MRKTGNALNKKRFYSMSTNQIFFTSYINNIFNRTWSAIVGCRYVHRMKLTQLRFFVSLIKFISSPKTQTSFYENHNQTERILRIRINTQNSMQSTQLVLAPIYSLQNHFSNGKCILLENFPNTIKFK